MAYLNVIIKSITIKQDKIIVQSHWLLVLHDTYEPSTLD